MRGVASVAVAAMVSVGCTNAKQVCGGSDAKFYDEGLIFHLTKSGVPYRRMHEFSLCVDEKYSSQLKAAERELERYFPVIAHKPKDACEERALVEWARRENVRFDLRQAFDSRNQPTGNLFLIRSFTSEELAANREKLERTAPKGATCEK